MSGLEKPSSSQDNAGLAKPVSRRSFLGLLGLGGGALLARDAFAGESPSEPAAGDAYGCLVDLTLCTGCRKCEAACNDANKLPAPDKPFEDMSVMSERRRPTECAFTVVNSFNVAGREKPVYVKGQCMHCVHPACASACLVGALRKEKNGAVTYDAGKCMGCRYCMIACPFQVPAYEYSNPLTPRVRKCGFCFDRISQAGGTPACAKACPVEAIEFGKRSDLLLLAKDRITSPGKKYRQRGPYVKRIFGNTELGGTSWMYVSAVPFEQLDFPKVPEHAPPELTESIQHGVFKYFIPPLALFSILGVTMHVLRQPGPEGPQATGEEHKS